MSQDGTLKTVIAIALVIGVAALGAQFAQAQEDTDAWRDLKAVESLLRQDAEAAVPRAQELKARTVDETDQHLRARVFLAECSALYRAGDSELAAVACDNANAIADKLGDPSLLARTRNTRATVAYTTGRNSQAFIDYEAASQYAVMSGDMQLVSPIQSNLAVIVRNTGAIGASLPYSQRALDAARALDDHSRIALALLNLSDTYVDLGQLRMAEDSVKRALEHADKGEILRWRYAARLQQAYLLLEQERGEEALAALNTLATTLTPNAEPRQLARLRILYADAYRATGDLARALIAAEESVEIVEELGDRWRAAMWRLDLAKLRRLNDDVVEALSIIDAVESFAREGSHDRLLRSALAEKAEILQAGQRPAAAFFALKESRDIESRMMSREAEEQLWLLNASEEARKARETIAALEQRSFVAERQAEQNLLARNAVLITVALALSMLLFWRHRSLGSATREGAERQPGDLRLETPERISQQGAPFVAEQQIRQVNEFDSIGRLSGGIAHDFNNLLTVVNGALELLRLNAGGRLDKQQLKLIENALTAGNAGAAITGQLLAFARQKPLQPERFDCVQYIRDISVLLRSAIGEQATLRTDVPDGVIRVNLDRSQLTTALLNLVSNARDAMSGVGEICLTVKQEWLTAEQTREFPELTTGNYVCISIRDNGCGMTPEEIRQAFLPFYSSKDSAAGGGLGLSMVYGFARQSDGTATLESSTRGGTTVTLVLPVADRLADPITSAPSHIELDCPGKALVVEDQDEVRVVACAFLKSLGFETVAAKNADEAVTMINLGIEPRFLLIDIVMPGSMNGREFADWAHDKLPGAEILLTTGSEDTSQNSDDRFPILRKPYRVGELSAYLSARFGDSPKDQHD